MLVTSDKNSLKVKKTKSTLLSKVASKHGVDKSRFKSKVYINTLPNNKFSDWSKLKAFADDKINVTEKLKFVFGQVENIVGKGENAGYQHFLLFPQCFQKSSFPRSVKVGLLWERVKHA